MKSTRQVAALLRIPYHRVKRLVTRGRVRPPAIIGRAYVWGPGDVARLRRAVGTSNAS